MFIPLVDVLRCPNPHEETWLVASIDRAEDRDIIEGALGCPKCLAEYPIRGGVVLFDEHADRPAYEAPREEDAIRVAASLDLTDASMTAVLHGRWGAHAPLIAGLSPAQLLLVNPPDGVTSGFGVSIVHAGTAPLARNSVHGAALDATVTPEMASSLVASLRPNARVLGPASMALPPGLTELVRDADGWVAQLEGATTSAPVTLGRRTPGNR